MNKIQLLKTFLIGAIIYSCQVQENKSYMNDIEQGLKGWYGFTLFKCKQPDSKLYSEIIPALHDTYLQFTGEKSSYLVDFDPNHSNQEENLINFCEDFYRKNLSTKLKFSLGDTNEVFLLHVFSLLDLAKTTGKGNFYQNCNWGRIYEKRTYNETIKIGIE